MNVYFKTSHFMEVKSLLTNAQDLAVLDDEWKQLNKENRNDRKRLTLSVKRLKIDAVEAM